MTGKKQIMSKFKKGESGNPRGRPPGQSQQVKALRVKIYDLVETNLETFQSEFNKLTGREKFQALDRLLKHLLPPPPSENLLDGLSDQDLDRLISYLKENIK